MQKINWILYCNTHTRFNERDLPPSERRVLPLFSEIITLGPAEYLAGTEIWIPFHPHRGACVLGYKRVRITQVERRPHNAIDLRYASFDTPAIESCATVHNGSNSNAIYRVRDEGLLVGAAQEKSIYIGAH